MNGIEKRKKEIFSCQAIRRRIILYNLVPVTLLNFILFLKNLTENFSPLLAADDYERAHSFIFIIIYSIKLFILFFFKA